MRYDNNEELKYCLYKCEGSYGCEKYIEGFNGVCEWYNTMWSDIMKIKNRPDYAKSPEQQKSPDVSLEKSPDYCLTFPNLEEIIRNDSKL